MLVRSILKILLVLCVWSSGEWAWACSCAEVPTFGEQVKRSPVVLLGRVKAQDNQDAQKSMKLTVAYLDVEVVETFKGKPLEGVVRIWDAGFGTNCGGALEDFPAGSLAVFSVQENREPQVLIEMWDFAGLRPDKNDYLVGVCGEDWKKFKSEKGARRYMRRLIH